MDIIATISSILNKMCERGSLHNCFSWTEIIQMQIAAREISRSKESWSALDRVVLAQVFGLALRNSIVVFTLLAN